MKIILLVSELSRGGAQRVASELSLNLPDNVKATLVLLEERIDYSYKGDLKVLKTKRFSRYNILGRISNFFSRYRQFKKIVEEEKPDWVIAFSPSLCFLSGLVFKNTVARANNQHSLIENSFFTKLKIKLFYNRARKIVAVSEGVKEDLQKNFGIKKDIEVIYNPVDLNNLQKNIDKDRNSLFNTWIQEKIPIIISVGRLTKQKGYWHLIRAFSKLRKNKICRLVILGQGPLEEELKKLSRESGVEKDIHFAGFQDNPFSYFSKAHFFVLSSLYEGFPNVLIEAMACGLPVISTDCRSGPREILAPDTDYQNETKSLDFEKFGILTSVPDGNFYNAKDELTKEENNLSSALLQMLENEELRRKYSGKSLERVKDFEVKKWVKKWLRLIN